MNVYSSVPSQRSQVTVSPMKPKTIERKFQKIVPMISTWSSSASSTATPMKATDRAAASEYTSQATSQPQYRLVRLKLRSTKARLARSSRVAMVIGSSHFSSSGGRRPAVP